MIYDLLYRDSSNYKKYLRADIPDNHFALPLVIGDEIEMETSGLTEGEFYQAMQWFYNPDYDHNKLEVFDISEDQISKPDIVFGKTFVELMERVEKQENVVLDMEEYRFAVDIPKVDGSGRPSEEWYCVEYFKSREEAIAFTQEHFSADSEGKVCLISSI